MPTLQREFALPMRWLRIHENVPYREGDSIRLIVIEDQRNVGCR